MRQTRRVEPREGESQPYGARAPESVTFESAPVTGGRQRPPIFAIAFVALVGGMVAIGLAGREPSGDPAGIGSPILRETPGRAAAPSGIPIGPATRPSPDGAPVVTNGEGPIVILARRHPETLYVHGDVFVDRVTWVFVSLQFEAGRIAGWASVSVPGSAGPAPSDGPTMRFDVEMALPPEADGRAVSVHVSAHDVEGPLVATGSVEIAADGSPVIQHGRATTGSGSARPGVFFPLLDATWEEARATGLLTRSERGGWPPLRVGFGPSPVNLVLPQSDRAVTKAFVRVQGTVVGRPDEVRVGLETSDHLLLDATVVDTHNVHGGIRPDRAPTIDVRLFLPTPRPEGERLWLVVTAYDSLGTPLSAMRRPVDIGPLERPEAP